MASGPLVPFKLFYGVVASGTGDATVTDLPFTPDWVLAIGADGESYTFSASSTTAGTVTLGGRSTTTATTISYIAGDTA